MIPVRKTRIWHSWHKLPEQSNRCANTTAIKDRQCYENKQPRTNTNKHAKQLMRIKRRREAGWKVTYSLLRGIFFYVSEISI